MEAYYIYAMHVTKADKSPRKVKFAHVEIRSKTNLIY